MCLGVCPCSCSCSCCCSWLCSWLCCPCLWQGREGRLGPTPGVTRNAYAHQPGPTSSSGEGCATRRAVGLPAERELVSVASHVYLELPTAHATMDDCTWGVAGRHAGDGNSMSLSRRGRGRVIRIRDRDGTCRSGIVQVQVQSKHCLACAAPSASTTSVCNSLSGYTIHDPRSTIHASIHTTLARRLGTCCRSRPAPCVLRPTHSRPPPAHSSSRRRPQATTRLA
jgi:hypothetical protein